MLAVLAVLAAVHPAHACLLWCLVAGHAALQVLQRCGMRHVPAIGDVQEYLANGPGGSHVCHPKCLIAAQVDH